MLGLERPTSGEVLVDGEPTAGWGSCAGGEPVEPAPTEEVFARPRHECTVELLQVVPGRRVRADVS